jgi:hypothetical protein
MEKKLKTEAQFNFQRLLTAPWVKIQSDARHEFTIPLPGKEQVAVIAIVKGEGPTSSEVYTLFRWIRADDLRRGKVTLTERDHFWMDDVRGWINSR